MKKTPMLTDEQVMKMLRGLMKFPYPQICRHSVALDIMSCMEENGRMLPNWKELVTTVVQANDDEALRLLEGEL